VLTADEIQAIPLFSTLAATDLARLAQTSADVHLDAGEWAVHEGGERALFAVLSGKIEVVKLIDGVERTLGWRLPGAIFADRFRVVDGRCAHAGDDLGRNRGRGSPGCAAGRRNGRQSADDARACSAPRPRDEGTLR